MAEAVPDLWRADEDPTRLYRLYLNRLQMNGRHERVVAACAQIRRYAARGPGRAAALFTFYSEIDSLCELNDYLKAWRRLRQREEIIFGERLDLRRRKWSIEDGRELAFSYTPLLYYLGRYRQGCTLLETSLDFWFTDTKVRSYDILFYVYNDDEEPSHRCRVTLSHFYGRLGRDLCQWRHWEAFVNGFHARLFRLSGIRREELMTDADLLADLCEKLMAVCAKRTTSGIGGSQSDLIESAAKVRKRQDAIKRRLREWRQRNRPVQQLTNRKLRELFPELQRLPE